MTDIGKLVLEAQKGNQQAMAALYEQCYRRACYLARQLVKDEDEGQMHSLTRREKPQRILRMTAKHSHRMQR
mgnify:CR=1 FL=1